jgi:hypothetical protein
VDIIAEVPTVKLPSSVVKTGRGSRPICSSEAVQKKRFLEIRNRKFESVFLQRRIRKLSAPLDRFAAVLI